VKTRALTEECFLNGDLNIKKQNVLVLNLTVSLYYFKMLNVVSTEQILKELKNIFLAAPSNNSILLNMSFRVKNLKFNFIIYSNV